MEESKMNAVPLTPTDEEKEQAAKEAYMPWQSPEALQAVGWTWSYFAVQAENGMDARQVDGADLMALYDEDMRRANPEAQPVLTNQQMFETICFAVGGALFKRHFSTKAVETITSKIVETMRDSGAGGAEAFGEKIGIQIMTAYTLFLQADQLGTNHGVPEAEDENRKLES